MAPRTEALVRPDLLVWARETSGLTREEAAKGLKVTPSRLEAWETGDQRPSLAQLRSVAERYKRPFAAFFLPERPAADPRPPDFRRATPDHQTLSPTLSAELRRARFRRRIALELLGREPPFTLPDSNLTADPEAVARDIRTALRVSAESQSGAKNEYAALALWIEAVESRGALVFQMSRVSPDEVRGFSLFDRPLPVIVLNGAESARARTFTLLHEVAHTSFRASGLCDFEGTSGSNANAIETACNRVAAAVLMPMEDFAQHARDTLTWDLGSVRALANRYWVSVEAVLLRLVAAHRIDQAGHSELLDAYRAGFVPRSGSKGGSFYRTLVRNNGYLYTGLVLDAFQSDRITPAEFATFSGGKLNQIPGITRVLMARDTAQQVVA